MVLVPIVLVSSACLLFVLSTSRASTFSIPTQLWLRRAAAVLLLTCGAVGVLGLLVNRADLIPLAVFPLVLTVLIWKRTKGLGALGGITRQPATADETVSFHDEIALGASLGLGQPLVERLSIPGSSKDLLMCSMVDSAGTMLISQRLGAHRQVSVSTFLADGQLDFTTRNGFSANPPRLIARAVGGGASAMVQSHRDDLMALAQVGLTPMSRDLDIYGVSAAFQQVHNADMAAHPWRTMAGYWFPSASQMNPVAQSTPDLAQLARTAQAGTA